jgi:hypothetical protein
MLEIMCVLDILYVIWPDNYCWLTFVLWPDNIIIIHKKGLSGITTWNYYLDFVMLSVTRDCDCEVHVMQKRSHVF